MRIRLYGDREAGGLPENLAEPIPAIALLQLSGSGHRHFWYNFNP
ncbi:hypothetical protein PJF56_07550 [Roseofilum sp. BLCC_M91]|uniref:Uncharacterized protein n=1 Tax=Roseofilum halophilum BLCC-M91 TaxID=3022259 RepID=A0ABT7BHP6_9CYAN|nr:hypothetical protein [Roseofilum halophilum]MDJ1178712.1 hypothetical protein [Roseofilum halophilum BLCC-M91]